MALKLSLLLLRPPTAWFFPQMQAGGMDAAAEEDGESSGLVVIYSLCVSHAAALGHVFIDHPFVLWIIGVAQVTRMLLTLSQAAPSTPFGCNVLTGPAIISLLACASMCHPLLHHVICYCIASSTAALFHPSLHCVTHCCIGLTAAAFCRPLVHHAIIFCR